MKDKIRRWVGCSALMVGVSCLVVGCGERDSADMAVTGEGPAPTQVAARVNGTEITVRQIDQLIGQRIPPAMLANATPEQMKALRDRVLEELIREQLIVNKAEEEKLDRKPEFVDRLDRARRDLLVASYFNQLVAGNVEPTDQEVSDWINQRSQALATNKRYVVHQILFPYPQENAAAVREQVERTTSLGTLARWLNERGIPFREQSRVMNSADFNPQQAATFGNPSVGTIIKEDGGNQVGLLQVLSVQTFPIPQNVVRQAAQQGLTVQKQRTLQQNELNAMRETATVEYSPGFDKVDLTQAPAVQPETAPVVEEAPMSENDGANEMDPLSPLSSTEVETSTELVDVIQP